MDIHHDTSLRSILEDDFISSTSRARIHSCLGKRPGLWLVVMPFICLFRITYFIFILVFRFHFGLVQPSTSNIFMCECGHRLDESGMHLVHCPFGGQRIVTHDAFETSCMPLLERMGLLYGESGDMPLRHEFDYEPIFTRFKRTRSLLPMWWLLT
jgi:hypothetical protein